MKRSALIIVLLIICSVVYSQAVFWEETFQPAPTGWTLDSNWSFSNGALQLSWSPTVTSYDLAALSPVISLPDNVGDLFITQYIDEYSAVNEIMEIGVIVNGNLNSLWQWELTNGSWGSTGGEEIVLSLNPYAGQDVQLQFRSYGESTWNFDYWYIYDAYITALYDNDLSASEVYGPPNAELNKPDLWKVIVKNSGLLPQSNYTVKIYKEGGVELGSIDVNETIEPLAYAEHNFFWTPIDLEDTHLIGEVIFTGDEFTDNNISENHDVHVFPEGERQYLVWDNDNSSSYYDPNNNMVRNSEYGLEQALISNGINFETVSDLPQVLRNYNTVFVCLGLYCVG